MKVIKLEYTKYYDRSIIADLLERDHVYTESKHVQYLNTAVSFDIETSSFRIDKRKIATMYVWAVDIYDHTIIGRTWYDFIELMNDISKRLELSPKKRMVCYVHNLAYEFGWMFKYFKWHKVFAIDNRKPLYAITESGIEFRCSFLLYGSKLENLAKEMDDLDDSKRLEKLKYNYDLIRTWKTELTQDEIEYLIHDVKIVTRYITRLIKEESGIHNIPMTKTGYVRRMCRENCLNGKYGLSYRIFIHKMQLSVEEYKTAKLAFAGGYTHSAVYYTNTETPIEDVTSYDFTSSYPAVMLSELYPMSKGEKVDKMTLDDLEMYNSKRLYIGIMTLENVKSIFPYEFYLSKSRCIKIEGKIQVSNGRIVRADKIIVPITSVDYRILKRVYKFDVTEYNNFYVYKAGYLPKEMIESVLYLYEKKTEWKDVDEKKTEYALLKGMLNATYGMCVTDILRDVVEFDTKKTEWKEPKKYTSFKPEEQEMMIKKANNNGGRFLFYLWGVFITAYARKNLWLGILECKGDYVYSDTDSVKIRNAENHAEWFDGYNKNIIAKISKCLEHHKIDVSRASPKTIDGIEKPLGVWDFDGHYALFKTLGAKRYLVMYSNDIRNKKKNWGKLSMTVAGLSKETALGYLVSQAEKENKNVFDLFSDIAEIPDDEDGKITHIYKMQIPADYSGKLTHTYIEEPIHEIVKDYNDVYAEINEESYVHLEKSPYELKISEDFLRFLDKYGKKKLGSTPA